MCINQSILFYSILTGMPQLCSTVPIEDGLSRSRDHDVNLFPTYCPAMFLEHRLKFTSQPI